MPIHKNSLVLDIETDSVNVEIATPKFVGFYSYNQNKYGITKGIENTQKAVDEHRYIVTFNGKKFDIPILQRAGIRFKGNIIIDLFDIIGPRHTHGGKGRAKIIKTAKGVMYDNLISYSLENIAKYLDLLPDEESMKDIDYGIFKKDNFTKEELEAIRKYLTKDVEVTKKLYEWLENYFDSFAGLMPKEQVELKQYLTKSPGTYAYKVVCYKAGLKEEYNRNAAKSRYKGGFVSVPALEECRDNIYAFDYGSAYPHSFIMCNLYNQVKEGGLHKNKILSLQGHYNNKEMCPISVAIKEMYNDRLRYKKENNPKEYPLKIVLNVIYGISGSEIFKNTYNPITSSDCAKTVRTWVKYARKTFRNAGYIVIYSVTDSIYLKDPFNDEKRLLKVKEQIVNDIKDNVAFPQETFDLRLEERIKYIQFFKDAKGRLLKNNYLYVNEKNKIVIKGLALIKSNSTRISKLIFEKYLKTEIIKNLNCKYSGGYLKSLVEKELKEDLSLLAGMYRAKEYDFYALPSQIQAQISLRYGKGNHFLIKNKRIGAGKDAKYCTVEEAKKAKLAISDLYLDKTWEELSYFINDYHFFKSKGYSDRKESLTDFAQRCPVGSANSSHS